MYMYMYMYIHIYVYVYVSVCVCVYIYIYIYRSTNPILVVGQQVQNKQYTPQANHACLTTLFANSIAQDDIQYASVSQSTPNPPTNIVDLRGFDSSTIPI